VVEHGGDGGHAHEYVEEQVPGVPSAAEVHGHGDDDDGDVGGVQSAQFFQIADYPHASLDHVPESPLVPRRSVLHVPERPPSAPSPDVHGNNICGRLHLSYQAWSQESHLARDDDYGSAAEPVLFAPVDFPSSSR